MSDEIPQKSNYDQWPEYLRPDTPPAAVCDVCSRKSWDKAEVAKGCRMPQPDGSRCVGRMEPSHV